MEDDVASDPRKYVMLAEVVRARISCGKLAFGARLPTIDELAEEQGVSRHTVGKALQLLAEQGVVRRVAGLGYFVRVRPPEDAGTGQ